MKTYEIILDGKKYNIIYYINGIQETKEFYSNSDGSNKQEIREGYILKVN